MQVVRSPWTGKMKIDKRKEETSGMMGANLAQCLLFLTPRDRGLQVKKLDEKFRHGKYPKQIIFNILPEVCSTADVYSIPYQNPLLKLECKDLFIPKYPLKRKENSNPIVNLLLGMNLP